MTTIETNDPQHHSFIDAVDEMNKAAAGLRVAPGPGALVLVGPSTGVLPGLDAVLAHPLVESVEAIGSRMMSWNTVAAEVIEVGRAASRVIRTGRTAVVHLDSHIGEAPAVPVESREFVCTRMGQILLGLADIPSYVVTHGERMARSLILESIEDPDATPVGPMGADFPIWQLSEATMFPGVYVSVCPGDQPATPVLDMLTWFEARRS